MASPEDARTSAATVADQLAATMVRASSFPEADRNERVDDEWSTVESLRHLVFVLDLWLSKRIRGEQDPFHSIGLPPDFVPRPLPWSSIDPHARPTFDEACDVLRGRLDGLRGYVQDVTDADLTREVASHAKTVGGGLAVIFNELRAHDRFINRDLDKIEHRSTQGPSG